MVKTQPIVRLLLDPVSEQYLEALTVHLGQTRSGIVRLALRRLAQVEGLAGAPAASTGEPRKPSPAPRADLERKSRPSRVQKAREGERHATD
jgi:hypothetical protein